MKITTIPAQQLFRGHSEGQEAFWDGFETFLAPIQKVNFYCISFSFLGLWGS